MRQTSNLYRRAARELDLLDDRLLADIGLERHGDLVVDPSGRMVRRLAVDVAFECALREIFSAVHGGVARSAD